MIAIPLLFGRLTAADYEDEVAADPMPRIDALRAKIECVEEPQFTRDYHDPEKRSIANSLRVELNDGTVLEETVEVSRSAIAVAAKKGCRCWWRSSRPTCAGASAKSSSRRILDVSLDREQLESMPVNEYVDLYVT